MSVRLRMATILFFMLFSVTLCCEVDDVAVYQVALQMLWSEERFPKDYPVSPKAQWSQVFGQSHNITYTLYRVGDVARPSVRKFVQTGDLKELVMEGDEETKVHDQFVAPAVDGGVGGSENMVLVDGGHSMVSLISRMDPSPDWFVGVDSLNLCVDSTWVDQLTLDLSPLDAGADSGITFTSPSWVTSPPARVSKIRPRDSNHPGSAFYYPNVKELPAIATVTFTKIKEYSTIELNDLARKELISAKAKTNHHIDTLLNNDETEDDYAEEDRESGERDSDKSKENRLRDLEEDPVGAPRLNDPESDVVVVTAPTTTTTTTEEASEEDLTSMDDVVLAVARGKTMGLGQHLPRHFKSRLHHAVNKRPKECQMSKWSQWSPCSSSCANTHGTRERRRIVLLKGRQRCPPLVERKVCFGQQECSDGNVRW